MASKSSAQVFFALSRKHLAFSAPVAEPRQRQVNKLPGIAKLPESRSAPRGSQSDVDPLGPTAVRFALGKVPALRPSPSAQAADGTTLTQTPFMPNPQSAFAVDVAEFAATLLAQQEVAPRAQAVANKVSELLPDTAAVVYVIADQESPVWSAKATAGDIKVIDTVEFDAGTLGAVAVKRELLVFEGSDLPREDYAHLDIRRQFVTLACVPLLVNDTLVGAIELFHCEQAFPRAMLQAVSEIAELAAPALASALFYESERNTNLHSISRVTQMYDLEKVFNSTLEMDELLVTIAAKVPGSHERPGRQFVDGQRRCA